MAQDLYDRFKLTTYPRTDSRHLPEDMIDKVDKIFKELGQQNHALTLYTLIKARHTQPKDHLQ